jgi:hypothetical protein
MSVARFDTAGSIVQKAALELGLGKITTPFVSDDPNIQQLCGLLASCGRELALSYDWPQLRVEHSIIIGYQDSEAQRTYLLPSDYNGYCVNSAYDRTAGAALEGPLTTGQWQLGKVQSNVGLLTVAFRIDIPQLKLLTQPAALTQIVLEYKSKAWVVPVAKVGRDIPVYKTLGIEGATDPVADGDVCLFDGLLLLRYLKLAFRTEKGFDTTSQMAAFMGTLNRAADRATPGPVLPLSGRRRNFGFIAGQGTQYEGPVIPTQTGLDSGGSLDDGELG